VVGPSSAQRPRRSPFVFTPATYFPRPSFLASLGSGPVSGTKTFPLMKSLPGRTNPLFTPSLLLPPTTSTPAPRHTKKKKHFPQRLRPFSRRLSFFGGGLLPARSFLLEESFAPLLSLGFTGIFWSLFVMGPRVSVGFLSPLYHCEPFL